MCACKGSPLFLLTFVVCSVRLICITTVPGSIRSLWTTAVVTHARHATWCYTNLYVDVWLQGLQQQQRPSSNLLGRIFASYFHPVGTTAAAVTSWSSYCMETHIQQEDWQRDEPSRSLNIFVSRGPLILGRKSRGRRPGSSSQPG